MTAIEQRPLPRVTVHVDAGDAYKPILLAEFFGEDAVGLAEKLIDQLLKGAPGDHPDRERYSISVSDDRCNVCGELFSSEARFETDEGWVCPVCGGDPVPKGEPMTDTTTSEYVLRIEPAGPDDEGNDDGMRFRAALRPMNGDPFPLYGYGQTAVEAAMEIVSAYV